MDDDDGSQDAQEPPSGTAGAGGWCVMLAEHREDCEWRTVGEPVEDAALASMAPAHDFAETRNRRQFGVKFDSAADPSKARLAVREDQRGALRLHEPD